MTDHTTTAECGHDWCVAPHEPMCDCPYASVHPHVARGCRYAPPDVAVTKRDGKLAGQEGAR